MTMHPQAKNKANIRSMAVTVTLVFSDEAHRESWLRRLEVISEDAPFLSDYEKRKGAQNLLYIVDPIGPGDFDHEKCATGRPCGYPISQGNCNAPQYSVGGRIECTRNHWEEGSPCSVAIHGSPCGARRYHLDGDSNIVVCTRGHREQVDPGT
jgi:hypothetical protein